MAAHPDSTTLLDFARMIPPGGLVVAVTDDGKDPRYAAVRAAATEIAATAGGKVLLLCAPPGQAAPGSVRPRLFCRAPDGGGGKTARPHTGSRRRDLLAAEAAAIRARGVGVAIWLSGRPGPAGMAEAVDVMHAAILLLPAEQERPGIRRRTLEYDAARIAAPVVAVDPAGRLARIRPLGGDRPAEGARTDSVPVAARAAGTVAAAR